MVLFGSTPAEFASDFSLEESVRRLRAAVVPLLFAGLRFREVAAGRVLVSSVTVCRVVPLVHNSFGPFFIGSFAERGERWCWRGASPCTRW